MAGIQSVKDTSGHPSGELSSPDMQQNYSYSTQPQAAPSASTRRSKYRDDDDPPLNIMADPRVFRGSNVANRVNRAGLKAGKEIVRRPERRRLSGGGFARTSSPPPVPGRQHADIQTEEYLEVLSDRPPEADISTQTPASLDRPSSPLFVRAKTGVDVETQILQGDLFDFDIEVEPLLEVLVGRTLHVAMLEVMQEEELAAIRQQQEEFEAVRNIELTEVQRLEAEARRKMQEKERRIRQERKRLEEQRELESKVAARAFAQQYISALHEDVFDVLEAEGKFVDPLKLEVEQDFMPALISDVRQRFGEYLLADALLTELLAKATQELQTLGEEALRLRKEQEEEEALERLRAEEERLQRERDAEAKAAEAAAAEREGDEEEEGND